MNIHVPSPIGLVEWNHRHIPKGLICGDKAHLHLRCTSDAPGRGCTPPLHNLFWLLVCVGVCLLAYLFACLLALFRQYCLRLWACFGDYCGPFGPTSQQLLMIIETDYKACNTNLGQLMHEATRN